ncbi:TOM1-like protein 2-like [Mucor ambiguus]|uniref:TOM1-like protein 2-like n=1 Tax=Mucor ambiguus TaxID=91626 RepID=A0A0C9MA54_9FUNG|nr:TOM1-like protein 2-like [Mucor ambiguus]
MPLFSKKIVPTDITTNIEKATNPSVTELDWALVFQICDSVNASELGAKEARKLLQKKMISSDPKTQVIALEILNSLAENCPAKFQPQLAAKSFGEELHTLASSKNMDDRVHGKLAQCLQTWVNQTGGDPQYGAVRRAYDIMMNGAALSGTNNSRRQVHGQSRSTHASTPREPPKVRIFHHDTKDTEMTNTRTLLLQPADVKGDIELAKNSAQLFSQTLSFTDPTQEDISKNALIQEFYSNCRNAQQTLAFHLETCEDSEIISALINANNELLSCFKSYDEMLEQATVNQATVNSQALHDRTSRNDEQLRQQQQYQPPQQQQQQLIDQDLIPSSSSSQPQPQQYAPPSPPPTTSANTTNSHNPYQIRSTLSDDPFDPFADTNQATDASNNAGNTLPPPLIPQKMHQ